jgi:hypothetical protein
MLARTIMIAITYDASVLAFAIALAMILAWCGGRWIGGRLGADHSESSERHPALAASKLGASLTLLSLLLGFTFSISLSRHERRLSMVVADSNAIGDFYTCASLLKEPVRTKLRTVIHDYTKLRSELAGRRVDEATVEGALRQMQVMQDQMTGLVYQALEAGTPIAVSLTNTLNGVTSNHAARLAAVKDRLPTTIVWLLLLSAVGSSMLVGREQGTSDKPDLAGTICFIVLVSFAIYVTLALNQPERGLIMVSQEPIQRLLSSMAR